MLSTDQRTPYEVRTRYTAAMVVKEILLREKIRGISSSDMRYR
jgi:hypothetical protein